VSLKVITLIVQFILFSAKKCSADPLLKFQHTFRFLYRAFLLHSHDQRCKKCTKSGKIVEKITLFVKLSIFVSLRSIFLNTDGIFQSGQTFLGENPLKRLAR